jgi:hypothetical protein
VLRTAKWNLKKQSQFADDINWRKLLFERKLCKQSCLLGTKKQSQTKPIAGLWAEDPGTQSGRYFIVQKF